MNHASTQQIGDRKKESWLFIAGITPAELPAMPLALLPPNAADVEHMGRAEREATPPDFAAWLVALARLTRPVSV